jgi:hypothetical protein
VTVLPLALFFGLFSRPAAAQNYSDVAVDHETWSVIGWDDACGVAFEHYYYPKLGDAMAYEPISTRIGTALIHSGSEKYVGRYVLELDGATSWDERRVAKTEKELKAAGYFRPGYLDRIQDAPIGNQPLLAETILSTSTLSPRLKTGWPGPEWRWAGGSFNPLATCELLVFENRANPKRYRLMLVRAYNSRVRIDRAYAHASNARLLFNAGNLEVAAPEAETAAMLAPELPIARYEHAAMLALTGRLNESVDELAAAVKLEPKYKAQAREDLDFADLRGRDDFKDITK